MRQTNAKRSSRREILQRAYDLHLADARRQIEKLPAYHDTKGALKSLFLAVDTLRALSSES